MHTTQLSATRLIVLFMALVGCASACGGSDTSSSTSTAAAAAAEGANASLEVYPDGHSDDVEGHDLAAGGATPEEPKGRFYLHPGDRGPDVTELQNRLLELGAPIGRADDIYGDRTLQAVMSFQRAEGLTPDGVVGDDTWAALDAPTKAVTWVLPELPTTHATDEPTTTTPQGPTTTVPAAKGDGADPAAATAPRNDPAAGGGAWSKAVVSLSAQTATFYDAAGNVVLTAPISSGKNGLTPVGTFHVQSKSARAFSGSNGVYMDSMTRFNGGIGFHSIPKQASGTDIATPLGQAPVSHGCIRMADAQAKQVFEHLPVGALVEVQA